MNVEKELLNYRDVKFGELTPGDLLITRFKPVTSQWSFVLAITKPSQPHVSLISFHKIDPESILTVTLFNVSPLTNICVFNGCKYVNSFNDSILIRRGKKINMLEPVFSDKMMRFLEQVTGEFEP